MTNHTLDNYRNIAHNLKRMSETEGFEAMRYWLREDLFFLLWFGCGRRDMEHPWLIARCQEVQANPDGYLDLWARESYKSTIITFGKTIQDLLQSHGDDPFDHWKGLQPSFGIFSHTRAIAKGFLRQIKRELEGNGLLKQYFPDIIWENPSKESSKWSEDDGLILKRKSNPKECTIEACGLVDGQPIGKHFDVMIYDDIVTLDSVNTPTMMQKTLEAWEMSINLGAGDCKRRHIGTRYHFNDTYRELMKRTAATPRIYPATIDGTPDGEPVLRTREKIIELRKLLGPYTFSTQQLLNPLADETQGFKKDWIRYHNGSDGTGTNKYIIVDPANAKKKTSDYTSMWVIGLGADENYYVLDMIRDRLNLVERADMLFRLHRKWKPLATGYEHYGMQADLEHIRDRQRRENYHFDLVELGGQIAKLDRIKMLIPSMAAGRWYFPQSCFKTNYENKTQDLVDIYINEEYTAFPVPVHDDMMDAQARILDPALNTLFPMVTDYDDSERYGSGRRRNKGSAWAG